MSKKDLSSAKSDADGSSKAGESGEPPNDDHFRRELRGSYRRLINDLSTNKSELIAKPPVVLKELIDRTDSLFINVKHCREAALDAQCVSSIAQIGRKKAEALSTGFDNFNVHEFCEKLILRLRGDTSLNETDDDDGVVKRGLKPENWAMLGLSCQTFFMRSPPLHFMYGSFEHEDKPKVEVVKAPRKRDVDPLEPDKPPKESDAFGDRDEERTSLAVDDVHKILRRQYRLNKRLPMCFMEFVVNPLSFSQTVENVFHTSFLIKAQIDERQRVLYQLELGEIQFRHSRKKSIAVFEAGTNHTARDGLGNFIGHGLPDVDGHARLFIDDDGLPAIEPIDANTDTSNDDDFNHQMVMAWTMEGWRAIVDSYNITEPIIPHRSS